MSHETSNPGAPQEPTAQADAFDPDLFAPPSQPRGRSATLKVLLLMFLALLMLLPASWLLGLVRERQGRLAEARQRMEAGWGGSQQLNGPLLVLPYRYEVHDEDSGKTREYCETLYLAPTSLSWSASLDPELRTLGIFEALLYRADLEAQAAFDLSEIDIDPQWIVWDEAAVVVGIGDPKGIEGVPTLTWNGETLDVVPATEIPGLSGFGAVLPEAVPDTLRSVEAADDRSLQVKVEVRLALAGSERITMVPIGSDSRFAVDALWPSPSFVGSHLPRQREISDESFRAQWSVPGLARSLPRRWNSSRQQELEQATRAEAFGVELILPAGGYQRTERAAKYTLLFVGLTFLAFFLFEVLSQLRLHPIQYLLVAAALVVFYLLLLALSEHVGFEIAYIAAAAATCALIALYSRSVLGSGRRAGIVLFELALLYSYLFIVLAAEDFALLFGASGLFAILGLVMWLTRHLDWYEVGGKPLATASARPASK